MSKKSIEDIKIPTYADLFTNEQQRQENKLEKIQNISVEELHEFKKHPFKVRMDDDMLKLVESIEENGILLPILVRINSNGSGYEVVSGHRRLKAAQLSGLQTVPAIIRELSDDQATIIMVDSNIQRENILPSERGFAYRMKLEAMNRQGKRSDLTFSQLGKKLTMKYSFEKLSEETGDSKNQIYRYIRLTELIEPLRDMVDGIREDKKRIALNPAVELSYLTNKNQELVLKYIEELDLTPSHAQTIRMKNLSKENRLDENVIYSIMTEEKANQKEKISLKMEDIDKFFPKDYTPRQKTDVIMRLLANWAKSKKKEHSR